jgi:hypothetical protein
MKMNRWTLLFIASSLLLITVLAGCFPVEGGRPAENRSGFFMGIWHGWIAPISLIVGIFDRTVRVYETTNTGWWYDLGFYMAIISGFGGVSLFRKRSASES